MGTCGHQCRETWQRCLIACTTKSVPQIYYLCALLSFVSFSPTSGSCVLQVAMCKLGVCRLCLCGSWSAQTNSDSQDRWPQACCWAGSQQQVVCMEGCENTQEEMSWTLWLAVWSCGHYAVSCGVSVALCAQPLIAVTSHINRWIREIAQWWVRVCTRWNETFLLIRCDACWPLHCCKFIQQLSEVCWFKSVL